MPINTASVLKDGVVATTGGVATAMSSLGSTLEKHEVFFDGADVRTRSSALFSARAAKPASGAPNGYTQERRKVIVRCPLLLDNTKMTVNTVAIEFAVDVETTQAEIDTLRSYAAQVIADTDFDAFWRSGSVQ